MIVSDDKLGVAPVAPRSRSMAYGGANPSELFGLGMEMNAGTASALGMGVALLSAGIISLLAVQKGKGKAVNNTLYGGLGVGLGVMGAVQLYQTAKS